MRKKPKKKLVKALGKQLGYVGRDLMYVHCYLEDPECVSMLHDRQLHQLETIEKIYTQQKHIYDTRTHSVPDWITSIQQPHVRPLSEVKLERILSSVARVLVGFM